MTPRNLIWRGMIKLQPIAGDDPVLDQSRALKAKELAFDCADTHGRIGLTKTKTLLTAAIRLARSQGRERADIVERRPQWKSGTRLSVTFNK